MSTLRSTADTRTSGHEKGRGLLGLGGKERRELRLAVQAACRNHGKLRMLVEEDCEQDYDSIVSDTTPFPQAVFAVIEAADGEGWLDDFVQSVHKRAPRCKKLIGWIARYRRTLRSLMWIDLFGPDREAQTARLLSSVHQLLAEPR
jgi:Effector-associated domain 1